MSWCVCVCATLLELERTFYFQARWSINFFCCWDMDSFVLVWPHRYFAIWTEVRTDVLNYWYLQQSFHFVVVLDFYFTECKCTGFLTCFGYLFVWLSSTWNMSFWGTCVCYVVCIWPPWLKILADRLSSWNPSKVQANGTRVQNWEIDMKDRIISLSNLFFCAIQNPLFYFIAIWREKNG